MLFIRYGVIVRSEGDQLIKNFISKEKSLKSWQSVVVIDKERSNELKNVLANFPEILSKPEVKAKIIKSFNFRIPVAYIKLYDNMTEKRARLIEELKRFFFVGTVYFNPRPQESELIGIAPITRFKNLCHVATDHLKKHNLKKKPDSPGFNQSFFTVANILVASSLKGKDHILIVKEEDYTLILHVEPDSGSMGNLDRGPPRDPGSASEAALVDF